MLRVLVTGGTGFIGRALVERLETERAAGRFQHLVYTSRSGGHHWHMKGLHHLDFERNPTQHFYLNLGDEYLTRLLVSSFLPDVVFHLAANPLVREMGTASGRTNFMGTHNLLAGLSELPSHTCRFVLASSATVYGNSMSPDREAREDDCPTPTSVYAATKVGAEGLVRAYAECGRLRGYLNVRMAAQVGPGSTHGLLHDIVKKLKSPSSTLDLIGDRPGSCKPYTHVEDTAAGLVQFGLSDAFNGTVNLALDDNLTVEQVAAVAMRVLGVFKPVLWLGQAANWPGDNRYVRVSNRLACNLWGWRLKYPTSEAALEAALRSIVEAQ